MRTLMIMILALGLAASASAQKVVRVAPRVVRPHVMVGVGAYPFYPWGWYNPYYAYPPAFGYYHRPTKLDLEIADIQNDYKDRIWSARHDTDLSRRERRAKVQELKHEKEQAIIQAKRDYYKR